MSVVKFGSRSHLPVCCVGAFLAIPEPASSRFGGETDSSIGRGSLASAGSATSTSLSDGLGSLAKSAALTRSGGLSALSGIPPLKGVQSGSLGPLPSLSKPVAPAPAPAPRVESPPDEIESEEEEHVELDNDEDAYSDDHVDEDDIF